jgi:hypothetical protein
VNYSTAPIPLRSRISGGWETFASRGRLALRAAVADALACVALLAVLGVMYWFGGMHP